MLETKIENQIFAAAQGRIRPRSSGKLKATLVPVMVLQSRPGKQRVTAIDKDHSRLAMQAAKRMKSSKDKLRTGRLVCLHLRSLLAATQSTGSQSDQGRTTQSIENRQYPLPM